jgi:hypothetical protein
MGNTNKTLKTGRKPLQRVYWPNCRVCQFLKKNKDVRDRVLQSTYFNPYGNEALLSIFHDIGDPFPPSSIYTHIQRHQTRDIIKAEKRLDNLDNAAVAVSLVETGTSNYPQHIEGLDEFIREGREKLARKDLSISSSTYLQAIKIKAEIERSTKDRKADLLKTMFAGAGPTEKNN